MRTVIDAETGKEFVLQTTDELVLDLSNIEANHCGHPVKEPRRRIIKGGSIAYWMQCQTCGESLGGAIPKASIPNINQVPDLDVDLAKRWSDTREAQRNAVIQKHVRLQKAEKAQWWQNYNNYLSSPEWRQKRQLVLDRAGGVCEGCRLRPADQVHHTTYEHVYREFLWELVAVCKACHDLVHEEPEEPEVETAEEPYGDEPEHDVTTASG